MVVLTNLTFPQTWADAVAAIVHDNVFPISKDELDDFMEIKGDLDFGAFDLIATAIAATNYEANDRTSAFSIADSTGKVTFADVDVQFKDNRLIIENPTDGFKKTIISAIDSGTDQKIALPGAALVADADIMLAHLVKFDNQWMYPLFPIFAGQTGNSQLRLTGWERSLIRNILEWDTTGGPNNDPTTVVIPADSTREDADGKIRLVTQTGNYQFNNVSFYSGTPAASSTKLINFLSNDAGIGAKLHLEFLGVVSTEYTQTFQNITDTFVYLSSTDILHNKSLAENTCKIVQSSDTSKEFVWDFTEQTSGVKTTLRPKSTVNRTIKLPDEDGTLVTENSTIFNTNVEGANATAAYIMYEDPNSAGTFIGIKTIDSSTVSSGTNGQTVLQALIDDASTFDKIFIKKSNY